MKSLHLLVQISFILTPGFCAPYRSYEQYSDDSVSLDQENENLQQTQDHEDFFDDSQQQTQVEDLQQYQQGQLPEDFRSGRLENFDPYFNSQQTQKHDLLPAGYEQKTQIEELNQYPEQLGQLKLVEPIDDVDDTQQTQDHEDFLDDSQQKTQAEDLHQYQAQHPALSLSGRLEAFDSHVEDDQQTKEDDTLLGGYEQQSHVEELNQYPEEQGQIKEELNVDVDDTQQTQDHGNLFDDSQQRTYNEESNQYGQGQVVSNPKFGRLEDLGGESEIFQQSQIQDVHSEDLSQYTQEQEPKIPKLQISQVRHEQQPVNIKDSLHEEEIAIPKEPEVSYTGDYDSPSLEVAHEDKYEQSAVNNLHSEVDNFELPHISTPAPGFWEKLKHKTKSLYNRAKDAGRDFVHHVREKVF